MPNNYTLELLCENKTADQIYSAKTRLLTDKFAIDLMLEEHGRPGPRHN